MHATYSERASAFDPHSRRAILASLDDRLRRRPAGAPAAEPASEAPAGVAASRGHPKLLVGIDDAGQRLVLGRVVDETTLDGLLRLSYEDDPDTEIVVRATKRAPRAAIVNLFDHAKTAGLQRLTAVDSAAATCSRCGPCTLRTARFHRWRLHSPRLLRKCRHRLHNPRRWSASTRRSPCQASRCLGRTTCAC